MVEGKSTGEQLMQPVVSKATHVTWKPTNVSKVVFQNPSGKLNNRTRENRIYNDLNNV